MSAYRFELAGDLRLRLVFTVDAGSEAEAVRRANEWLTAGGRLCPEPAFPSADDHVCDVAVYRADGPPHLAASAEEIREVSP